MLTIFTIPKPFKGDIAIAQTNAIKSWTSLRPACEVILFGNDEGIAETAARLGVKHLPEVECNEQGTPLLSSVFRLAHQVAKYPLLCLVNTDIILMSDFLSAVQRVKLDRFLMVGLRWDLDLKEAIDFDNPQWEQWLRGQLAQRGRLHPQGGGGDYFLFPRGLFESIPPFAIGRTAWDNWLIYRARALGAPVIDATSAFVNVHQNHDYSHHPGGTAGVWKGPESQRNVELMGGMEHAFTMDYATARLTPSGLRPALTLRHIYYRLRAVPVLHPHLRLLLTPFQTIEKLAWAVRRGRT